MGRFADSGLLGNQLQGAARCIAPDAQFRPAAAARRPADGESIIVREKRAPNIVVFDCSGLTGAVKSSLPALPKSTRR